MLGVVSPGKMDYMDVDLRDSFRKEFYRKIVIPRRGLRER